MVPARSGKQTLSDYIEARGTSLMPHETAASASDVVLKRIIELEESPTKKDLLDLMLPPRKLPYTWQDVDNTLGKLNDELETIQREANDDFDRMLPDETQLRLDHLTANLQEAQQQVLRLQCNIGQTRDLHQEVRRLCNEKVVEARRDVIEAEKRLKKSLQESKFKEILEFFGLFVIHLDAAVASTRLALARLAANPFQSFDWPTYHQAMYLLRACGKALIDVDKFERLYQLYKDFTAISFKNPINQMDMSNFIQFPAMYSVETQLNVIIKAPHQYATTSGGEHESIIVPFGQFLANPKVDETLYSVDKVKNELFGHTMDRLSGITRDCCRLIIDLNLNYIEAHFTSGINIDKLNGCETSPQGVTINRSQAGLDVVAGQSDEPLPSYAFSPQEYITQIGQHVLTLRKQTEQFDQMDNRPLKLALDYLRYAEQDNFDSRIFNSVAEIILKCIARHCIRSLIGRTTKSVLAQLTPNGKRQLATDAMYLDNVLEDLDLLDSTDESVEKFKLLIEC